MAARARGTGGGGRDVIFRLRVMADPQDMKTIRQFAEEVAKAQKKFDETAAGAAKKRLKDFDNETRQRIKQEDLIAKHHLRTQTKAIDERQRLERRAAQQRERDLKRAAAEEIRLAQQRDSIIAKNHLREHLRGIDERKRAELRAAKDAEREAIASARRTAQAARREHAAGIRSAVGARFVARGGIELGRGIAYSGLMGEKNTDTLLRGLIGVEAASSIGRAGIDIAKGAGMMGLAGSASTVAAALAAVAASAAAVVITFETIRDVGQYGLGGGAAPGSASERVGGFLNSSLRFLYDRSDTEHLQRAQQRLDPRSARGIAVSQLLQYRQLESERERLGLPSGSTESEIRAAKRDEYRGLLHSRGALLRESKDQRGALRSSLDQFNSVRGEGIEVREAAARNVLDAERRILEEQRKQHQETAAAARERLDAASTELSTAREIANERRRLADAARSDYASDILKFATLDPASRAAVRRIDAKRDRGETLTEREIEIASGFNEFRDTVASSAEKRADAAGARHIFTSTRAEADRLSREATEAAKVVARSELTVKTLHEHVHRIERDDSWQEVLQEGLDRFKKEFETEMNAALDTMDSKLRDYARKNKVRG